MKKSCLLFIVLAVFILSFPHQGLSQQSTNTKTYTMPPQLQQAVNKGLVSPQQAQAWMEALEKGQITVETINEALKPLEAKGGLGTLTREEIEMGKKLLDEKIKEAPKEAQKEAPRPEQKIRSEMRPPEEKKPAGKQKPAIVEDEYFKKTTPEEAPELEIFGHKLFGAAPSTFAPITSIPVSNDYIIGPGDEIRVLMWGRLDAFYTLEVDNEGVINFPKVGPMTVAGLTFGEIKELIRAKAESITGVNVNVSMGKLRTIQVFVLGEVISPGVYTVSSLATVTNALLASGGPTALGSLRKVELKRRGKTVTVIDLYDFLLKGDTSADVRLMPGDSIFIPQAGSMVSVSGNVKRPSIYEMKDDRTLQNAIDLAGGLKPRAYNQRIQIERAFQNRVQIVLDISYEELLQKKPIPLMDGDLIRIFSIHPASINAVFLFGNVIRPGEYAYEPGLRVLNVIPDLQSLDLDTYFDYALIKRYRFEDSKSELIPFNLGRLLVSRDLRQNIVLKPKDEIYVFNKKMFEDAEHALVEGQVRKPGRYPIEDMKVRDLIFKAGNLTKDAYMDLGHLYRTNPSTKEVTMMPFNVAKVMEGDPLHNLPLKNLDFVVILSQWDYANKYTVTISGKVNRPGDYPYATNMTVRDLILVGGNVMESAYMEKAELVRYDIVQGKRVETSLVTFDVKLALANDPAHNLRLKPFDVVNVKEIPEWKEKRTVTVTGEFVFPGTYQLRKEERLSSIIQRAGGFTEHAYLRAAFFTRESVKKGQQERLNELMKQMEIEGAHYASAGAQAALSQEDVAAQGQFLAAQKSLIEKLREAKATGRVVISLLPSTVLREASLDMVLEDGDTLYVPKSPNTVSVLGAVYNPNALIYEDSRPEVSYYLKKTGGPTENAEADKMYVVRADGTVVAKAETGWFNTGWSDEEKRWGVGSSFEDTRLYAGDTVLVPQKVIKPSFMKDVKDITTILYQIAVGAGVVIAAF
jgi:protein involved in polysaccharide export with SLBB domain